ncbi:MAG: diguanylate cyclase [Anaerolineaceae bacterium]|nr:diguanylate cyclase [Anaerolineaceae bacterium]
MSLDIHTICLIFGLTVLLEVVILYIQFRKGKDFPGFLWLMLGTLTISFYYLFLFTQEFISYGIYSFIIEDIFLAASGLILFHGVLDFFRIPKKKSLHPILFLSLYGLVLLISLLFDNFIIPNAVSTFSFAGFSFLIAIVTLKQKSLADRPFRHFIGIAYIANALFYLAHTLAWLILPAPDLTNLPTTMQVVSYFVLYASITLWNFGLIYLMNLRLNQETIEAEEKYTLMFNTIPDSVLITRLRDGLFIEVNQGFIKMSGYTREEVIGHTTLDVDIWFDPTERARFIVLLTETGVIEDMEFQFRKKNGRPLLGLLSSRIIQVDNEPHILSVVRDITSRKKMEEKLRENEQKYRFLTENSGDVIWHINKRLRIDYMSPADESTRGFKREEVIGQQIWAFFKPEGVELVRQKIAHHQEKEEVGNNNMTTRFEIEQKCKDGSWIWTEVVAAPHYDNYGNLIGYHGLSRDITERKQLLDQLYHEATIDELTNISNRRHFMNLAELELRRARRYHHPLSVVILDFDNLKGINDTYGHLAGDRALTVFAKIVKEIVRDVDILGRFGGDEFLLLLPETDGEHALLVMERIRSVMSTSPVFYGERSFTITFSAGIASVEDWSDSLEDLLNRADNALYRIKEKGGDGASTSS